MIRRPPRSTRTDTLFPYTTLFRSDVEIPDLARIECKATRAKSFSVTRAMFQIVEDAALLNNQIPYIEVEFVNDKEKDRKSVVVGKECVSTCRSWWSPYH